MSTTIVNLFLEASRKQLRFATNAGQLSVEDLWSLSLASLDSLAIAIDENLKESTGTFLKTASSKKSAARAIDELRLEILKTVIEIKQTEAEEAKSASAKREQLAFLKGRKEKKALEKMDTLSEEDIDKEIAKLSA